MKDTSSELQKGSETFFHSPTQLARKAFFYPLCLGHYICKDTYRVERSNYDSFLLMYVVRGAGYVTTPGFSCSLSPRQVMLIDCYQPHTYGASGDLEFYWVHFDGIAAAGYVDYLRSLHSFPLLTDPRTEQGIRELFSLMIEAFTSDRLLEITLGKYITDLLTLLAQTPTGRSGEVELACSRAAAYMRRNFPTPLSIPALAEAVSLSTWHFIRCFREQYGVTPYQYLLRLRLDSARFYLRTTKKTVKEIAYSCGFQSENSFCMTFKKQTGMTPTCYRDV